MYQSYRQPEYICSQKKIRMFLEAETNILKLTVGVLRLHLENEHTKK